MVCFHDLVLTKNCETLFFYKKQPDFMMLLKMGKRIHLCEYETDNLADGLNNLFKRKVEIPRTKHGKRQTIDTLINEEAFLLAKYLRNERKDWKPRIISI
jgi:hypothetical protein